MPRQKDGSVAFAHSPAKQKLSLRRLNQVSAIPRQDQASLVKDSHTVKGAFFLRIIVAFLYQAFVQKLF
jgi:hypothetical protein